MWFILDFINMLCESNFIQKRPIISIYTHNNNYQINSHFEPKIKCQKHNNLLSEKIKLSPDNSDMLTLNPYFSVELKMTIINFINVVLFELVESTYSGIDLDNYPNSKLKKLFEFISNDRDRKNIFKYFVMIEEKYYDFVWDLMINDYELLNINLIQKKKNHIKHLQKFTSTSDYVEFCSSSKLFQLLVKYKYFVCFIQRFTDKISL